MQWSVDRLETRKSSCDGNEFKMEELNHTTTTLWKDIVQQFSMLGGTTYRSKNLLCQ